MNSLSNDGSIEELLDVKMELRRFDHLEEAQALICVIDETLEEMYQQ